MTLHIFVRELSERAAEGAEFWAATSLGDEVCCGTWAHVTIGHFRHWALQTF